MIKKLATHGNSAALIIDKPILELLKINMETPLELTTDGRSLIISPISDEARESRFQNAKKSVFEKHRQTMERLAK